MATHSSTLAWKSHGQRCLLGCSPWGREESDTSEAMQQQHKNIKQLGRVKTESLTFQGHDFHFHALEKEMATHFSVLAWRILGTAEPSGLPSLGSHRFGHD